MPVSFYWAEHLFFFNLSISEIPIFLQDQLNDWYFLHRLWFMFLMLGHYDKVVTV